MRKELPQQLLRELLKNSKRSDRELAKVLDVSQPTITRTRQRLEREGIIQDYTIIPDLRKLGRELLALTFVKFRAEFFAREMVDEIRKDATQFHEAIFLNSGEGLDTNFLIISLNKNYTEYHSRLNRMRVHWKDFIKDIKTFIVPIGEGEYKRFSLTYLKDIPL